jgi:hypothetical protein
MGFERQILRLMAAMIAMVIAYAAPSAVQAHEGHAHHGHHHGATQGVGAAPPSGTRIAEAKNFDDPAPAPMPPARTIKASGPDVSATGPLATIPPVRDGTSQCDGAGNGSCCGPMACCAAGILPGPSALPALTFGLVSLLPSDIAGRYGTGPGALPKPPRTLA